MACIIKGNDVIPSSGGITPGNVTNVNISSTSEYIDVEFTAPENIEINGSIISENTNLVFAIEKDGVPQIERSSNGSFSISFASEYNEAIIFYSNGLYDILNKYGAVLSYGSLNGGTFKVRFSCPSQGTYYIRFAVVNSDKMCNNSASAIYKCMNVDAVFGNNSWKIINEVAESGNIPDTWNIGDEIVVNMHGFGLTTFQIWDFNHYNKSDGSGKAGIVLGCKDILFITFMNPSSNNDEGWEGSDMSINTMAVIYDYMPKDLRNVIKTVNIGSDLGDDESYKPVTIQDQIFLPCCDEVGISASDRIEGTKFPIFSDDNSRKKDMRDSPSSYMDWWLRSSCPVGSSFYCVTGSGGWTAYGASGSHGVVFCFNI